MKRRELIVLLGGAAAAWPLAARAQPAQGMRRISMLVAAASVNAFENVEPALLRRGPATFEGENEKARLSRRKRNWIADVQFEATS